MVLARANVTRPSVWRKLESPLKGKAVWSHLGLHKLLSARVFMSSCNKSAQMGFLFVCFCPCRNLSGFSLYTGIRQAFPGLCPLWAPSPDMSMLLSPLLLPRLFLALAPCKGPGLSGGITTCPPMRPHPAPSPFLSGPAANAALWLLPLSLPSGNTFSGTV